MYVLRLGVISSLLADSLVSGFTTAAAMHVFTSQIRDLLGLSDLPRRGGAFKLILVSNNQVLFGHVNISRNSPLAQTHAAPPLIHLVLRFCSFIFSVLLFPPLSFVIPTKMFALDKHLGNHSQRFL